MEKWRAEFLVEKLYRGRTQIERDLPRIKKFTSKMFPDISNLAYAVGHIVSTEIYKDGDSHYDQGADRVIAFLLGIYASKKRKKESNEGRSGKTEVDGAVMDGFLSLWKEKLMVLRATALEEPKQIASLVAVNQTASMVIQDMFYQYFIDAAKEVTPNDETNVLYRLFLFEENIRVARTRMLKLIYDRYIANVFKSECSVPDSVPDSQKLMLNKHEGEPVVQCDALYWEEKSSGKHKRYRVAKGTSTRGPTHWWALCEKSDAYCAEEEDVQGDYINFYDTAFAHATEELKKELETSQ